MTTTTLFRLHKWLGLGIAAWLALVSVTGLIWTLRDMAADSAARNAMPAQCGQRDAARDWRAALGAQGEQIVRLDARDETFRILRVSVIDPQGVRRIRRVDQCTGILVKPSDHWETFMTTALWLHGTLIPGPAGKQLIGALGIASLVVVVIGTWLWWLRSGRSLRRGLKLSSSRQGIVRLRSWHQIVGALTAVLMGLAVPSGVLLAYSLWLVDTPAVKSRCGVQGVIENLDPYLDAALRSARERLPEGAIRSVRLEGAKCVARVHIQSPSAAPRSLIDRLWIDLRSSQVIAHSRSDQASVGQRAWAWASVVHSGHLFGRAGWLLPMIAGAVLLGLAVTGVVSYFWSRRLLRARATAATASR